MASEFLLVLYMAAFGVAAGVVPMLIIAKILSPTKRNPIKEAPFESGQVPTGPRRVSLMMQYYSYLLMFVAFDVMSMFLFAWGVSYMAVGFTGMVAAVLFILVLLIPMGYTLYQAGRRELW